MKSFQGYVTVRKFNGFTLPVPMQNMLMREYCRKNDLLYILPLCEMQFENCYMQLNATMENLKNVNGIMMCSLYMLPEKPEARLQIYREIIAAKAEMHFILENKKIVNENDIAAIEELYCLQAAIDKAPRTIDLTSLGMDLSNAVFCG